MSSQESLDRGYLATRRFSATGKLVSMTHAELSALVQSCGGQFVRYPPRGQLDLVVGSDCWGKTSEVDDLPPTRMLRRAKQLRACGYAVTMLTEDEFLQRVGLTPPECRLRGQHTIGDISRILQVSTSRIRWWVRVGLIRPAATKHRMAFFNFDDVAFARRLSAAVAAGTPLGEIRRNLERMREWIPDSEQDLIRLGQLESDGRVLMRMGEHLVDQRGQRYLDFEAAEPQPTTNALSVGMVPSLTVEAWFDRALQLEDNEDYEAALQAYQAALMIDNDDPALHFNLGNVLFQLRQYAAAAASYQSSLQRAPSYAEAWNNLGNAQAERRLWDEAIVALRNALRLVPDYADAHFNLSGVYQSLGQDRLAHEHLTAYQQISTAFRLRVFD